MSILNRIIDAVKVAQIVDWLRKPPEPIDPVIPKPEVGAREIRFVDKFAEGKSDPEYQAIDRKCREAIAIARSGLLQKK